MSYYTDHLLQLVGGKIVGVTVSNEEMGEYFGIVIEMPSNARQIVWFLSDDEGNAPGSFDVEDVPAKRVTLKIPK